MCLLLTIEFLAVLWRVTLCYAPGYVPGYNTVPGYNPAFGFRVPSPLVGVGRVRTAGEAYPLIVGGVLAEPGEFPFAAELVVRNQYGNGPLVCGSTIVSNWWIVTAAHCVFKNQLLYVTVGQHDRTTKSPNEQRHNIAFGVVNRLFKSKSNLDHDIALIKLQTSIVFTDTVQPANFPTNDVNYAGKPGIIIGWGVQIQGGPESDVLRKLQIVIDDNENCRRTYRANRYKDGPTSYEVCVKSPTGKGACGGDSGGPLIVREGNTDFVIGLTSRGGNPCGTTLPEIYVLIYKFRDWMKGVMQKYQNTVLIQGGLIREVRE